MSDFAEAAALTGAELRTRLQQALALLNRNEFAAAEAALEEILSQRPEEPDALQLMGLLRRQQNRPAEAEQFYRRSVAANPNLPQVHHNLGNLLRAQGRSAEAAGCQRAALRLRPNYIEAHMNLGLALQDLQDYAAAEQAFRDGLRIQPNSLMLKQCLGGVLNDQKRGAEAERLLRQALPQATRDPRQAAALLNNLGISLKVQGRHPEALDAIEKARMLASDVVSVDYNRANVLQHLGRLEEAVDAYRSVIARNPTHLNAHRDLNQLLYRLGRDEEFLRSYDDAALLYPEIGLLYLGKANFLFHATRYEEAQEHYARAAALLPNQFMPRDGLAVSLARLGRFDEAIAAHESAVALDPQNLQAWVDFSETLLRAGDAGKARSATERAMAIAPDDQHALAMWGLALRALDDAREDWLNDYERFVQVFELEPPEGYADMAAFNRDLNESLDALHRDNREFLDQTLRGGTQTLGDIFGAGHELVERLRTRVDEAVRTYIARMKDDAAHPLVRRRQALFQYAGSWSSRLRDCGFHTNHVHPKGWISSAYYIAVPDAVEDAREKQGWIKFGEPAFDAPFKDAVRRAIRPVPGRLVLFPSYMWHGTAPFHSAQSRTTIAFDAVPK